MNKLTALMASGEVADISATYLEAVVANFVAQGGQVVLDEKIAAWDAINP